MSRARVMGSPEQQHAYEQVATAIVDRQLSEFAAFIGANQRRVEPRKWKAFKKHESVEIYRSREQLRAERAKTPGPLTSPLVDWEPMAKLLCVGTLLGDLDDAMYGAVTPTELAMATRSLYINDEFTQHRVLLDIHAPTPDDPFRYLGIKWGARASSVATLVKPRETLYLEASGCREVQLHAGGHERIGYVVYHSVDLAEVPKSDGMVRARVSACYLFRQSSPGIVELYATMISDAGGHLPSKLAALAGGNVMIAVSKVTECALKKKLAWMLSRRSRSNTGDNDGQQDDFASSCVQCSRSLSSFSSLTVCLICHSRVCSRCTTSRRLILGRSKTSLRRKTVDMCKSCISMARQGDNTAQVAGAEFGRLAHERGRLPSSSPSTGVDSNSTSSDRDSLPVSSRSNVTTQSRHDDRVAPVFPRSREPTLTVVEIESDDEHTETVAVAVGDNSQTLPAQWAAKQVAQPAGKVEWWMRINELRLQAEETYQFAKEQTMTMQQASSSRVVLK